MKPEVRPLWVVFKALILFIVINVIYAWVDPSLGSISAYNVIFPGRVRFSFGSGSDPYVASVDNLDVMAASHIIARPRQPDEYRVVLIGDSSVWGENTSASETMSEQWNDLHIRCGGRQLKFYNFGYPHPSVVKDLVILDKAMEYEPDLVVWFVTLNTLIPRRLSPFIVANSERAAKLMDTYGIPYSTEEKADMAPSSLYERTLLGRRSVLARAVKLQVLGLLWAANDQDKRPSRNQPVLSPDVEADPNYRGIEPGKKLGNKMMFHTLVAGWEIAGETPILFVNEPIYIASGRNSEIRYNQIYPRWAFDQYRAAIAQEAQQRHWNYLDLWDAVPSGLFYDTGLHPSAEGEAVLIQQINPTLQKIACP